MGMEWRRKNENLKKENIKYNKWKISGDVICMKKEVSGIVKGIRWDVQKEREDKLWITGVMVFGELAESDVFGDVRLLYNKVCEFRLRCHPTAPSMGFYVFFRLKLTPVFILFLLVEVEILDCIPYFFFKCMSKKWKICAEPCAVERILVQFLVLGAFTSGHVSIALIRRRSGFRKNVTISFWNWAATSTSEQ